MKMRILGLTLLVLAAGLASCKKNAPNGSGPEGATVDRAQNPMGTKVGSAAPPLTQPSSRETQLLTRNIWVAEFYVLPGGEGKLIPSRENKGLWWQFNMDGTYAGGQWDKQLDYGTWTWRPGSSQYDKSGILFVDSATDDMRDAEFQMQGIESTGEVMSWVKTEAYGDRQAALLKVIQMLSLPTKKQFGVE
ncbi:MAG: hypothetical protein ACOYOO_05120 [Saprospiraceae bacterium]